MNRRTESARYDTEASGANLQAEEARRLNTTGRIIWRTSVRFVDLAGLDYLFLLALVHLFVASK